MRVEVALAFIADEGSPGEKLAWVGESMAGGEALGERARFTRRADKLPIKGVHLSLLSVEGTFVPLDSCKRDLWVQFGKGHGEENPTAGRASQ